MPDPIILDLANASNVANTNFTSLTAGTNFALPTVDFSGIAFQAPSQDNNPLYGKISNITTEDLTTLELDGTGVFDKLMRANKVHLTEEFERGRITGEQYAKAYIEMTTGVMNMSLQFVLQREQNYWSNILLQSQARQAEIQAVTANTQLEISKAELVMKQYDAKTSEATYALTKMKLSTENAQFSNITAQIKNTLYQVEELLPLQKVGLQADNDTKAYQLNDILPEQKRQLVYTTDNTMVAEYSKANFEFTEILPLQKDSLTIENATKTFQKDELLPTQKELLLEQVEVQNAQTSDLKTDGVTPVTGSVGKQIELYTQQITSYKRDSEYKTAKMFLDGWITQKTLDEGLNAPAQLTNINIDSVLSTLRNNNSL